MHVRACIPFYLHLPGDLAISHPPPWSWFMFLQQKIYQNVPGGKNKWSTLLLLIIRDNITEIAFLFPLLFLFTCALLLEKGTARGWAKGLNQGNSSILGRPLIAVHFFSLIGCSCSHPSGPQLINMHTRRMFLPKWTGLTFEVSLLAFKINALLSQIRAVHNL